MSKLTIPFISMFSRTQTIGVLLEPVIDKIEGLDQTLRVFFKEPKSHGGDPIINYEYRIIDPFSGDWTQANVVDNKYFDITGLINNTEYRLRIRAVNNNGAGKQSSQGVGTPMVPTTVPDPPVLNSLTPIVEGLHVGLTPPQSDGGLPILTYKYNLNGGSFIDAETTDVEFIIPDLQVQEYTVRLIATNANGDSSPSNSLSETHLSGDTEPDAPTIDSVNSGNTEIFVNFTLGSDGGSPITNVEYQLNGTH